MRTFLISMIVGLLGFAVQAQQLPDDPAQAVIQRQLNAFQQDDFEQAFTFASPVIKNIFRTPERFGEMVRNGYPMVWRPGSVDYLDQAPFAGGVRQKVLIEDANGALHVLEYEMIETRDGWQINGVQFLGPPSVGA